MIYGRFTDDCSVGQPLNTRPWPAEGLLFAMQLIVNTCVPYARNRIASMEFTSFL